jgi:hypothetical protein
VISISACGRLRGLFAILGSQTLASFRLYSLEHVADFFGRPAVDTLLDFGAQRFELDLTALFALFNQAKAVSDDLARARCFLPESGFPEEIISDSNSVLGTGASMDDATLF